MAKSWYQVVKDALQMYKDRDKYAYFYGAKGQKLTKSVMDALWNAEPDYFKKYSAAEKEQIYRNSLNKIGLDCSGFVTRVTGETGYSIGIYNKRTKETSLNEGVAGQFLFTTFNGKGRHIGLDIGWGFTMDMGNESTDYQVSIHRDSVRMLNMGDVAWEHSFQTAAVNYNNSYAFDPNNKATEDPIITPAEPIIIPSLPTIDPDVPEAVKAVTAVNVRADASATAAKVTFNRNDGRGNRSSLAQGEVVKVTDIKNGWYHLEIVGASQVWRPYANSKFFEEAKLNVVMGLPTTKLNTRSGPGNSYSYCTFDRGDGLGIRHALNKGEEVPVITERADGWYQVEIVGAELVWRPWCASKYMHLDK